MTIFYLLSKLWWQNISKYSYFVFSCKSWCWCSAWLCGKCVILDSIVQRIGVIDNLYKLTWRLTQTPTASNSSHPASHQLTHFSITFTISSEIITFFFLWWHSPNVHRTGHKAYHACIAPTTYVWAIIYTIWRVPGQSSYNHVVNWSCLQAQYTDSCVMVFLSCLQKIQN